MRLWVDLKVHVWVVHIHHNTDMHAAAGRPLAQQLVIILDSASTGTGYLQVKL